MGKRGFRTEVHLGAAQIDQCAEQITEYLRSIKTDQKEIIRLRLSAEEILLRWQAHFGEEVKVRLTCYSNLGQQTIQLRLKGEPFDPLSVSDESDDAYSVWGQKLLSRLQTTPTYAYFANTNTVTFRLIRQQRNPLMLLLAALAAAAVTGLAGALLPEAIRSGIVERFLSPMCDTYIHVLEFFAIPLIFLSVVLGICGVGDTSSFGRISRKMSTHFLVSLVLVTIGGSLAAYPFFRFLHGSSNVLVTFDSVLEMLLGFLPTNLVKPFLESNAMQLIIMGVLFGIAILKLDPITAAFSRAMEGLNAILLQVSQWFTRLIPFFVYAIIVRGFWSGELAQVWVAWKSWVITTGLQVLALGLTMLQIILRHKVPAGVLLKKLSATFLIAFGTNSCSAVVPEIDSCCKKLGVSPRVSGFGIPVGTSVFKPSCVIRLIVLVYFMASVYQVEVSLQWFIMAGLMAFLLPIAIPTIPGGVLLFCPMLFAQLGIPAEAMTTMLATDVFFDATCTAFCQVSAELALLQQAGKMDLLDEEQLRR